MSTISYFYDIIQLFFTKLFNLKYKYFISKIEQQLIELELTKNTLFNNLNELTGEEYDEDTKLAIPVIEINDSMNNERPELKLFDLQKDPNEMNNVYNDPTYAEDTKILKNKLLELKKQYGDTDDVYPEMKEINQKYW